MLNRKKTTGKQTSTGSPEGEDASRTQRNDKRVTMTDVAREAGYSQSTVSVVLNNSTGIMISAETKERVREAAKSLGYRVRQRKRPVAAGDRQIAVIFDRIATSPEAVVSIDGAREQAWGTGHIISAYQTLNHRDMEPATIDVAVRNGSIAIIYATIMTREVKIPAALKSLSIPVVLLNCYSRDLGFPTVLPGEVAGGHRATETLIAAGHRRIAHITGEMWMDAASDRVKGYRQALATADIPFDPQLVREGNWQPSAGYEQTHALMDLTDPPTAIFVANDRMAVGCYEALKERGLRIPDDVSVVGYDDEEVARHLTPQLTTLVLPHREMGRWAVETALARPKAKARGFAITKLECPLVERESVGSPRR